MELFVQLRAQEGAHLHAPIQVPCRGYFTNWRVFVWGFGDSFEMKISKKADVADFHGSSEVLPNFKGLYAKFASPGSLDAVPELITGFSKKKMHVRSDQEVFVQVQTDSPDFDAWIQATFVPFKGEILKARYTQNPDVDGPLTDQTRYIIPVNGKLKGIHTKAILHETSGAAGGAFLLRYTLEKGDSYYLETSAVDMHGDVRAPLDENPFTVEQLKYGKNELADFLVRTVQNEPTLVDFTKQMDVPVYVGDAVNYEWDAYLADTTIDTKMMEVTYFIEVKDSPNIQLATEHIEFMDNAALEGKYFLDLGSDFFVET